MSASSEPSKALPLDQAALVYARKWDLIDDQGQLWCIQGCGRAGRLPILCCAICLVAVQRGQR